jgi:hypothetical protein
MWHFDRNLTEAFLVRRNGIGSVQIAVYYAWDLVSAVPGTLGQVIRHVV